MFMVEIADAAKFCNDSAEIWKLLGTVINIVKIAIPIAIAGVISSIGGAFLANNINSFSLKIWFGVFLVIVGVLQIYSLWLFKPESSTDTTKNKNIKNQKNNQNKS